MIQSKIVARYLNGQVMKGITRDFMPSKEFLHLLPENAPPSATPLPVTIRELKALFFVKDFKGDPQYREKKEFSPTQPVTGRKIKVAFNDGEVLVGTTQGYQPGRPGFFLFPADSKSNAERCYIVSTAVKSVSFI
jgi:hypothetical protein